LNSIALGGKRKGLSDLTSHSQGPARGREEGREKSLSKAERWSIVQLEEQRGETSRPKGEKRGGKREEDGNFLPRTTEKTTKGRFLSYPIAQMA